MPFAPRGLRPFAGAANSFTLGTIKKPAALRAQRWAASSNPGGLTQAPCQTATAFAKAEAKEQATGRSLDIGETFEAMKKPPWRCRSTPFSHPTRTEPTHLPNLRQVRGKLLSFLHGAVAPLRTTVGDLVDSKDHTVHHKQLGFINGGVITLLIGGLAIGGLLLYGLVSGQELPVWPAVLVGLVNLVAAVKVILDVKKTKQQRDATRTSQTPNTPTDR